MSQPASGLLPALVGYYQRLENDPNEGVAEYGFSVEKIHFQIVLEPDGTLFSFDDIRLRNDKGKPIPGLCSSPTAAVVPASDSSRSSAGTTRDMYWVETTKGKPERAEEMFAAFRELHSRSSPNSPMTKGSSPCAVFLDAWKPERAESLPNWEEAAGLNVVFKLRRPRGLHSPERPGPRRPGYVHDSARPQGKTRSRRFLGERRGRGIGARLHPQIKGVAGANTTGAGHRLVQPRRLRELRQVAKLQRSGRHARRLPLYRRRFNRLLADDARRVRIGDATVVFWSDRSEGGDAEVIFRQIFGDDAPRTEEAEHTRPSTA